MADHHDDNNLHQFDVYPLPSISSSDQNNLPNSVTDMFHQSQSQPHSDPSVRVIEDNNNNNYNNNNDDDDDDNVSNQFDPDFEPGSGLGFLLENNPNFDEEEEDDDDNNSGFLIADCTNSSQLSGLRIIDIGSDSDQAEEPDIVEADGTQDASFSFRWDVFRLEDEIPNPNSNAYEDFEWEEVDDDHDDDDHDIDDDDALVSPVLLTAFQEPIEEPDAVEWQVLSNVHNFDPDPDPEDQYEDYNYTEYEMFFGQFADNDAPLSGRPPASKTVVDNLSTVVMSQEDVCAVCKDEVVVGELVTRLPCGHGYHGGCILPWLAVRNTCPVCRHELPTDDVDYERRKVERGGNA